MSFATIFFFLAVNLILETVYGNVEYIFEITVSNPLKVISKPLTFSSCIQVFKK